MCGLSLEPSYTLLTTAGIGDTLTGTFIRLQAARLVTGTFIRLQAARLVLD